MLLRQPCCGCRINSSTKPTTPIIRGEDTKKPVKSFTVAAMLSKDSNDRIVWHKEVKLQIKSLDQMRSERTPIPLKESMNSPKVWRVDANDKGRVILERMQADIRERKAAEPLRNKEGFSGKFNQPTKTVTEDEVIQKVRTEARAARAKVPPDMRAEPNYFNSKSDAKDGFSGAWEKATHAEPDKPKQSMSSKFNQAAKRAEHVEQNPKNFPNI